MWIKCGPHRLISAHAARLDSIQLRPITHSESFALYFKGHEEQMVNVGEDLDRAEALLAKLAQALSEGKGFLDLDKI
jgi:hypothetical protein